MLTNGSLRCWRSSGVFSRRSFDSFVVTTGFQPGLVLLEGLLAQAWGHLAHPLSVAELDRRLGTAVGGMDVSQECALVVERLTRLGLMQSEDSNPEAA